MAQNPMVEQAKQGNVNAIASLMNRLLKSQGMLANVEREGDRLEILIESDLRSLDDEVRIPKRQILVGMLKKWFVTLEVQNVSSIIISWQQTGFEEPAWTEKIILSENLNQNIIQNINQNGGVELLPERPIIPPLPVLPPRTMLERDLGDRPNIPSHSANKIESDAPDLDEMFGDTSGTTPSIISSDNLSSQSPKAEQESELLLLSDVPSAPEVDYVRDVNREIANSSNNYIGQILFKTPSFAIQFVQYLVVCAIVILALRGIHAAFGTSKAPKAASIQPQIILL